MPGPSKRSYAQTSIALSSTYKGKPRPQPVWIMRYRLPSGKDSRKVLGPAWTKKGRPPSGYLTRNDALLTAEMFAAEHSVGATSLRLAFGSALERFLGYCAQERRLHAGRISADW